jgi:asparagine synthase (glutamine-hydrolysing)
LGFILSSDPANGDRLGHSIEWPPGEPASVAIDIPFAWRHDSHASFSRSFRDNGWQVLFEGYLAGPDSALDRSGLPRAPAASPAERVRALLEAQGPSGLSRLQGSFALAAWNPTSNQILATRDRCGGRTLYYNRAGRHLTLSTRSAWLVRAVNRCPEEDAAFITSLLALQKAPPPGRSAFEAVAELMPGELLVVDGGARRIERAPLDLEIVPMAASPSEWAERFLGLLEDAVRACLPDDGEVACMLSGGLDSGPAAVLADRLLEPTGRGVRAISWSLERFPDCDESDWIRKTASTLRQPLDLADSSDRLPFSRLDESTIDPDLPVYNAFRFQVNDCYRRAAQNGCSVILNGAVGDRIYAPRSLVNLDRARRGEWGQIRRDLARDLREGGLRRLWQDPAYRHPLGRWLGRLRRASPPPAWLTDAGREYCPGPDAWPAELDQLAFPGHARQLFGASMAFGVAHEVSQAQCHGLDRRDPFQNEALLKFMLEAPMDLSWRGGADKSIMRRAMRGLLPDDVRYKARTGRLNPFFRAGIESQAESLRQLLFDEQTGWQDYVDSNRVAAIIEGSNGAPDALLSAVVGHALWRRHWEA